MNRCETKSLKSTSLEVQSYSKTPVNHSKSSYLLMEKSGDSGEGSQERPPRGPTSQKNPDEQLKNCRSHLSQFRSIFTIHNKKETGQIWCKTNTEFHNNSIKPTVKTGGGTVMVWGCFTSPGQLVIIDGISVHQFMTYM